MRGLGMRLVSLRTCHPVTMNRTMLPYDVNCMFCVSSPCPSYVGVTIGPSHKYSSEPYDRARELRTVRRDTTCIVTTLINELTACLCVSPGVHEPPKAAKERQTSIDYML